MKIIQILKQSQLSALNILELQDKGSFFYDQDMNVTLVALNFFDKLNLFFQRIFCCHSYSTLKLKSFTKISHIELCTIIKNNRQPQEVNKEKKNDQTPLINRKPDMLSETEQNSELKQKNVVLLVRNFTRRFFQVFIDQYNEKYGKDGIEVIEDINASNFKEKLAGYNYKQMVLGDYPIGRTNTGQENFAKELDELTQHKCLWVYVQSQGFHDTLPNLEPYSYINGKKLQPLWKYNQLSEEKNLLKKENLDLFNKIEAEFKGK